MSEKQDPKPRLSVDGLEVETPIERAPVTEAPVAAEVTGDSMPEEPFKLRLAVTDSDGAADDAELTHSDHPDAAVSEESVSEESVADEGDALEGVDFIQQLESRHDRLLADLDDLNDRVEQVLESYLTSRTDPNSSDSASGGGSEPRKAAG